MGLVFKEFSVERNRKLLDRIRKINSQSKNPSQAAFDQSATTLIYGSDEEEDVAPFYP